MRFHICRVCQSDRSMLSLTRRALLAIAVILLSVATVSTFPARAQNQTSDQYRIADLERRANASEEYGARLSVVETHYEEVREQLADIKTWMRGIGMALLIAVGEKLLSALGIRVRRRPEG